jgi:glycosyltransferase involved in cell wall biosynthesis
MNIVIVTDAYPPEVRSSSHLMVELAEGLSALGHSVHVLTGWPRYNLEDSARRRTFEASMMEDGVHVVRVRTLPHHNVGYVMRGLAQISMPFAFLGVLNKFIRQPVDAVVVYTPPLPLAFVGEALRRRGARYLLNVQDLFPQNAIDLGVLRNPVLVAFYRWMEKRAYSKADIVTAHSEANRVMMLATDPELGQKLRVLHNWVDTAPYAACPARAGDFRKEWGLEGQFLALFAGVMGPSQALDVVLDTASATRDLKDLTYLIVGDGMEKPRLVERARGEQLDNVVFKPFVSREDYPLLVDTVDVGLVCLSSLNTTPVVPGKILGYMAGAKPIAAFLNVQSDGHGIIRDAGCGYSCASNDPAAPAAIMRSLYNDRSACTTMGSAGEAYVSTHFAKDVIIRTMSEWLNP